MATAREAVRIGLGARGAAKIKIRQPLRAAVVVAAGREREAIERHADVIAEELNVKDVRLVAAADELGSYTLKANYRTLGPRFGKQMPQVAAAIEALDADHVAAALRDGRTVGVSIDGHDHELTADDLQLVLQPLDGYQVERDGAHAVALDLAIDDDAAARGTRARRRARDPERAQGGRARGLRPHRADARRRRRAARRGRGRTRTTSPARCWRRVVAYDDARRRGRRRRARRARTSHRSREASDAKASRLREILATSAADRATAP